jgi:hypothetical protein
MKKNKILLIVVVLLIALSLGLVLTDKNTTLWGKESNFAVKDTANIVRVYMVNKNNQSILLDRKDHGWRLNDSLKAHHENIQMLLNTLKNLEVKYPVPQKAYNTIVKVMAGNTIKVEVYQNDYHIKIGQIHLLPYVNKARVFYVGGATQNNLGTYMIMEGAKRPYVVTIPGFRGFVAARFTVDYKDWMSHAIFRIPYNNIAEVSVETPATPERSMRIRKLDKGYEIEALQSRHILERYDTVALYTFLDAFKNVNFESLMDEIPQKKMDSILASPKVHILKITETNGKKHLLTTYRMRTRYETTEKYGYEADYDLDRLYAWYNNQLLMIQYFTFDKITRPIDYFYPHQQGSE